MIKIIGLIKKQIHKFQKFKKIKNNLSIIKIIFLLIITIIRILIKEFLKFDHQIKPLKQRNLIKFQITYYLILYIIKCKLRNSILKRKR